MGTENFDAVVDRDASGGVLVRRMFGSGFDEVLSRSDASGVRWYGTDRLGTVHEWFDAAGVRVGTVVQFDGYGTVVSGALSDRYGFTGREWDSVVGLQYSRARMYSPTQGRFTSEDPLGLRAGDANFYRYVGNQPTGRVDPSGLIAPIVASAAIGGGIAALSYYLTTPEDKRTAGGLAQAVAVGALSGALGGYVFGSYFAGATAPATSALITRAGVVSGAYAYSAGYALEKYLKGDAINLREYANGLAWSSLFGGAFAKAGSWFAQGGTEKVVNAGKLVCKRIDKFLKAPNSAPKDGLNPETINALKGAGLSSPDISKLLNATGDIYVFRGTTTGFPGNPGLQKLGVTPTSIDPVVATVFAAESRTLGSNPVVLFGPRGAFGESLQMGNFRRGLEREVAVPLSPTDFAAKAPHSIPLDQSRAILGEMGITVPEGFGARGDATQYLESAVRMSVDQIRMFIVRATRS